MKLPATHKFPRNKHRAIRELLQQDPQTGSKVSFYPSPAVMKDDLLRVHPKEYVDRFASGEISEQEMRTIGFPWSDQVVRRQFASVGGTLAAAKALLEQPELKIAGHLAGEHTCLHKALGLGGAGS